MADYNSKVVLSDGTVLMDLTGDTVDASHLLSGYTAHGKDGSPITGTCTYDSDTSDDNTAVGEVLSGKTFHARGTALTGTMTNVGQQNGTISTKAVQVVITQGYHDGSGKVTISTTEQAKIIAGNIKSGVQILGVTGSYSGESVTAQAKAATPSWSQQVITPDADYDYLSQVTVSAIPIVYSDNAAGGKTVTIG